jgi:hypothetical protein
MRVRIELETMSDVNNFCAAAEKVKPDVYLVDRIHRFKVNAKSQLACMLASAQWGEIYCECDEDIYSSIEPWVARNSNVSEHE